MISFASAPPPSLSSAGPVPVRLGGRPLNIFVPHAADVLTDHRAHGDGLVAYEVVSRLAARGHHVAAAAPEIDVTGALPATLRLFPLGNGRPSSALGRLRYMAGVRRLYRDLAQQSAFDIVHQLNPVFTGMSLALWPSAVPTVLGSYVGDWPAVHGGVGLRGLKRAVAAAQQRHAARLLVTTPAAVHSRIVAPTAVEAKTIVLPHGIDPAPYARDVAEETPPAVLFLGGLEVRKGIFTLLDAFEIIGRDVPDARLVIAGEGHAQHDVCRRIDQVRGVTYLGRVSRADVPNLLGRCAVFALPSDGEPFGMSLLEAMASGKPVVVGDAGGPPHIVDALGGFRVVPGDVAGFARALGMLLRSAELRRAMGAHNRRIVAERFAWDAVIDRLESVYAELAPGGGRA